jgi:trans-aconitate methyltransferase
MSQTRWDAAHYAANNAHHRAYDDALLADLPIGAAAQVVDIGCGTGELAARIASRPERPTVLGVDADAAMVAEAQRRHAGAPGLRFAVTPVQSLTEVTGTGRFAVAVSTAMLHWVRRSDQPAALREICRSLQPGGLLRADLGAAGQLTAALGILDEESARLGGTTTPWFFPTEADYADLLDAAGFEPQTRVVRVVRQRRSFDAAGLLGWLDSQTLVAYTPFLPASDHDIFRERCHSRAFAELRRSDGSYDQDFVRLHVTAHRPVHTIED